MIFRLYLIIAILTFISSCSKVAMKENKTAFYPIRIYHTNESKDTSIATRYDYQYDSDGYLLARTKREKGSLMESISILYGSGMQPETVVIVTPASIDSFYFRYSPSAMRSTISRVSLDRKSGMLTSYTYLNVQGPSSTYPVSRYGRIMDITDSVYENGQYLRKKQYVFGYGTPATDQTDVLIQVIESLPGAPDISTVSGRYRISRRGVDNPFAFVRPDLIELPSQLWFPWPLIRGGLVNDYELLTRSGTFGELDTYEVSKTNSSRAVPDEIRITRSGRRSGIITVEYLLFTYR